MDKNMDMDIVCQDCRVPTEIIDDRATGDSICTECGLVVESYNVDQTSEWRIFSNDDDNKTYDPNRVGIASNPLLDDQTLTTTITNTNGTKPSNVLNRGILRGYTGKKNPSDHLEKAFERLEEMASMLGLKSVFHSTGCELYKKVFHDEYNQKTCRPRNLDAVLAACLLVACQLEQAPRTIKEICSVATVVKKDVMKAKNSIMKHLTECNAGPGNGVGRSIRAGDVIKRFCSNLDISDRKVVQAAVEAANLCETEVDVRRSPISVAAAVIYVMIQLNRGSSLKQIAVATKVAEGTIRSAYKDIYPHASKFVPSWYADHSKIKNMLCAP